HARLIYADGALPKLLVEHGDLMAGQADARLGLTDGRLRLLLTRPDLLVVEHGDDLAGLHRIAFPDGDLTNPPGGLRGDGGIVALDATAHRDHARRSAGRSEHDTPHGNARETEQQNRGDHEPAPALTHARRLALGGCAASP